MTMADLAEYAEFNKDFMKDVQAARRPERARTMWRLLEDSGEDKGYAAPAAVRLKANVQIVMDETK